MNNPWLSGIAVLWKENKPYIIAAGLIIATVIVAIILLAIVLNAR